MEKPEDRDSLDSNTVCKFLLANIIMVMNLTVNEGYVGSSPT